MKKKKDSLWSNSVLVLGFVFIFFLTLNALVEYQKTANQTEDSWADMSELIYKITLLTDIFDAQNKLKNTLDAALVTKDFEQQNALFRQAASIRKVIVKGRKELMEIPLTRKGKKILEKQGLILENGFSAQIYYENLLLQFEDREEAMHVLFNQINVSQSQAQNLFSEYYYLSKEDFNKKLKKFSDFTQHSARTNKRFLALNLALILIVGFFVIVTVLRRDRLILEQTKLLKEQNANLENQVTIRTQHLEKARLAEKQANEAKSEFLAIMSHEIRTPLNGMLGALNLIGETQLTIEEKGYLNTAKQSSDLLLMVINDILDYSKIESGKFSLNSTSIDLEDIAVNAGRVYRPLIENKGLQLQVNTEALAQRWVLGDGGRIAQIINNYMNNAIKFTEQGSITLTLKSDKEGRVLISVADTGMGIKQSDIEKLFQDFTQVHKGSNRQFGGSGLGLVICRKLAQLMQGDVSVTSEFGIGSEFHAELKLAPINKAAYLQAHKEKQVANQAQHNRWLKVKVLLVEDNKVNQLVAQKLLEKFGHEVIVANNGLEALQKIEVEQFDVVLMDCQMPVMDGFEATRKIREMGIETPIIALTANAQLSDQKACFAAGVNAFVSKPFKPEILMSAVQQALKT